MRSHKARSTLFLHGLSGVCPSERVGHCGIVIADEFPQLRLQICYRCEVAAAQELPVDNPKDDLDLVEPRTMLRQVDEADPVLEIRQELPTRRHRFEDAAVVFFPARRVGRSVRRPTSPDFPTCGC